MTHKAVNMRDEVQRVAGLGGATEIFRSALAGDIVAALDHAESVYRGLEREGVQARCGLDDDTFARLQVCAKSVYEGLCRMQHLAGRP